MSQAENQPVREWAQPKLVGAQVDFSAGCMPRLWYQETMCKRRNQSDQVQRHVNPLLA